MYCIGQHVWQLFSGHSCALPLEFRYFPSNRRTKTVVEKGTEKCSGLRSLEVFFYFWYINLPNFKKILIFYIKKVHVSRFLGK